MTQKDRDRDPRTGSDDRKRELWDQTDGNSNVGISNVEILLGNIINLETRR